MNKRVEAGRSIPEALQEDANEPTEQEDVDKSENTRFPRAFSRIEMSVFIIAWTAAIGLLFLLTWRIVDSHVLEFAEVQARSLFEKDVIYRQWNAEYGGVYAPVSSKTPPNPYLDVPERDIETPSGRRLTLINPAYMTRQVHELGASYLGISSHITSLRPLRPENAPDPWERRALEAFEKGAEKVSTIEKKGGKPFFRYMAPLKTQKACLKCHARQGYKEGEIRGGISILFPMTLYIDMQRSQHRRNALIFGAVWLLGVVGMIGAFFSINRREKEISGYQKEIREKNIFLETVLNSIQDGISVLDKDLCILLTNMVMEKWYAANMPLCGKKCYAAYHNKSKPCDFCPTLCVFETGKPEKRLVPGLPGSPVTWLEIYVYPIIDPKTGDVSRVVEFVRDMTRPIEDQEKLLRIQAAVEHAQNFIVITGPDGRIIYVNPYFTKSSGYKASEVIGKLPLVFRTTPEGERIFKEEALPALRQGDVWARRRMEAVIKDGSRVQLDITVSPVFNERGELINIVIVGKNITREIELETRLMQAQKMESIGQLAGGVAHDFNNLLQVINGFSEIALLKLEKDHPVVADIQRIRESGSRAADIVQQLLAFSRRQVLRPELLVVNDLVSTLLKILKRVIGEHIRIEFIPGASSGRIYADKTMLEQVLMNLCVNARDAMPGGGVLKIETEDVFIDDEFQKTHSWAKPGRYTMISVSDTGCGMDRELMEQIFDPFFTTKEMGRGTGLGLATVYGIVKQHDGMIHVYSEPGMGSAFKVYFPIVGDLDLDVEKEEIRPVENGSETILVAEDSDEVRSFIVHVLESAGYRVMEAANGEEALDILSGDKGGSIHAVLLDVVMPRMSGWDVYQRVKKTRPELTVLFMSGYGENGVHTNFVVREGCLLIEKPFSREMLLRILRKALS